MTKRDTLTVLGSGYVARFTLSLTEFYSTILYTSREPHTHLSWVPLQQRLRFDLAEPETWKHLPSRTDLLWCFPAAPLEAVRRFAHDRSWERLVVLGSTSAYDCGGQAEYPPPWIDETAPVDVSQPRVQGEEFLRQERGAIVLRLSGIYGPGRNPYNWIRSGRVALSKKYVNLIHVEDIAEICLVALQYGVAGAAYNVSDGIPRTWREIGRRLDAVHDAQAPSEDQLQQPGKRISTAKLRSLLQEARIAIRHPDLFRSLERIDEQGPASTA